MSKRAEELWKQILDHFSANNWHLNERVMLTLIDAELRKERERCAERAASWCGAWLSEVEHRRLRAAILSEEE